MGTTPMSMNAGRKHAASGPADFTPTARARPRRTARRSRRRSVASRANPAATAPRTRSPGASVRASVANGGIGLESPPLADRICAQLQAGHNCAAGCRADHREHRRPRRAPIDRRTDQSARRQQVGGHGEIASDRSRSRDRGRLESRSTRRLRHRPPAPTTSATGPPTASPTMPAPMTQARVRTHVRSAIGDANARTAADSIANRETLAGPQLTSTTRRRSTTGSRAGQPSTARASRSTHQRPRSASTIPSTRQPLPTEVVARKCTGSTPIAVPSPSPTSGSPARSFAVARGEPRAARLRRGPPRPRAVRHRPDPRRRPARRRSDPRRPSSPRSVAALRRPVVERRLRKASVSRHPSERSPQPGASSGQGRQALATTCWRRQPGLKLGDQRIAELDDLSASPGARGSQPPATDHRLGPRARAAPRNGRTPPDATGDPQIRTPSNSSATIGARRPLASPDAPRRDATPGAPPMHGAATQLDRPTPAGRGTSEPASDRGEKQEPTIASWLARCRQQRGKG